MVFSLTNQGRQPFHLRFGQICSDLVKEFKPITALRAATWTNHRGWFRPFEGLETGFKYSYSYQYHTLHSYAVGAPLLQETVG